MPDGLTTFDKSAAPAVNTSNPESAAKSLADIAEYAKQGHAAGEDLSVAFKKVEGDLSKALKQIEEMRVAAAPATSEEDMSLKSFVVSKDFRAEGKGNIAAGQVLLRGLYDDRTKQFRPGLLDQTSHVGGDWAKDLRKAVGDLNIVSRAKGGARNCPIARARVSDILEKAPASVKSADSLKQLKAFVDNPAGGGEWIIDLGIPDLIQNNPLIRSALSDAFRVHQMSGKEEVIPAMTTGLRPYKTGAQVSDDPAAYTSSSLVTEDRRRTVSGMSVLTKLDREAAEDAILNIGEVIRRELSLAIRDGREDCILNGDTAASHQDAIASWNIASRWGASNLGGAGDHRRAYDGLRKYCLNTTVGSNAAKQDIGSSQTFDGIIAEIGKMTGTGGNIGNTIMVLNKAYLFSKLMLLSEFKQAYILGRSGTADRAELPNFAGYPIYITDFMGKDLASTGLYTGSGAKTAIQVVNLDRWEMNQRLGTVVEMDTDITRNQNLLVARVRESLWSMEAASASATNLDALYLYNLDA